MDFLLTPFVLPQMGQNTRRLRRLACSKGVLLVAGQPTKPLF